MLKPSILTVGKFEHYAVTEHGITFQPEAPIDAWLDSLKRLCALHEGAVMTAERTLMLLADALNFGEGRYGEKFTQAIEGTREALGLTPKTVSNAKWAYSRIPPERRKDGLTLGHYIVVAALPESDQDHFIGEALEHQMKVNDLKQAVAEKFPTTKKGKPRAAKPKETETAATARQKLVDVSNYTTSHPDWFTEKDKEPLEILYKAFRRKWQSGRKK